MERDLNELNKLEEWLKDQHIPYTRVDNEDMFNTIERPIDLHQIRAITPGGYDWDVICHYGSYGCDQGLLEGMGAPFGKDVEGWLTAKDVIDRIRPFYNGDCNDNV